MTSYQYRKSHCGDKTILRPSYLHNGISYTGKTTSLYWIGAQVIIVSVNGLLFVGCQAITCTNADLLSIWPLGVYLSETLIKIQKPFFKKMNLTASPIKDRSFCQGLKGLIVNLVTYRWLRAHCSSSIASAMELPQSCAKQSLWPDIKRHQAKS